MRGKAVLVLFENRHARITPAYAGKSQRHADTADRHEDHPRLCGEKARTLYAEAKDYESPPPMRGKGTTTMCRMWAERITPAYAGKSYNNMYKL